MNSPANHFREEGWVKIPGVIEGDLLEHYKDHAIRKWDSMGRPRVLFIDDVHSIDSFVHFQLNPKLLEAVKSLFSNPCYINDTILMFNIFDEHPRKGGWHIDAGSEIPYGDYLLEPDYKFAKIGIFFQPNLPEAGGGIDVISASHRQYSHANASTRGVYKARNKLLQKFLEYGLMKPRHLEIRAGDAVIFDSRLLHKTSTPPIGALRSLLEMTKHPDPKYAARKMAMYWNVCEAGQDSAFLYNSYRRSLREEVDGSREIFFTRYLARRFPDDYPDDYVKTCLDSSIRIAQVPENIRSFMHRKYQMLAGSGRP